MFILVFTSTVLKYFCVLAKFKYTIHKEFRLPSAGEKHTQV
jgi:hypothetical protein